MRGNSGRIYTDRRAGAMVWRWALSILAIIVILASVVPVQAGNAPNDPGISNSSVSTYIVVFKETPQSTAQTRIASDLIASYGGHVKHQYKLINGMAVTLPDNMVSRLESLPNVEYVEKDQQAHILLDYSVSQIMADRVWVEGYTGTGVKVAVLDTGVDASHPDLNGGKVILWNDFTGNYATPHDGNGHGTHVSSIIAGTGNASGGKYKGVAPNASLIEGKVLDDSGSGYYGDIIAGMDWAVDNGAQVISLSLGGPHSQSLDDAVANATAHGVVVVVAAGNSGYAPGTIKCPGDAPTAITVGAVDKSDVIAYFSSRGPTSDGSIKPDVTNVGVNVVAARASSTSLGYPVDQYYTSLSGTSMATPMTAGVVALMLQKNSSLTPAQVKYILEQTSKPLSVNLIDPIPNNDYGWGRVQAKYALDNFTYSVLGYSSSYLLDNINDTLTPGDYSVTITMLNNGTQPWSKATNVTLHCIGDAAEFSAPIIQIPDNVIIPPGPGQQFTWTYNLKATTFGEYNLMYQMYVNDTPIGDMVIHPIRVKDIIEPGNMIFVDSNYEVLKSSSPHQINLTVQRVDCFDNTITVKCSASGGNGTAGIDYSPASSVLTFAQDQQYANFTVTIYSNGTYTGDKTVNFTLSAPTNGAGLGTLSNATLTIIDDNLRPILQFSASNYIVPENQTNCTITVKRIANSHGPVSVNYSVGGGNATPGLDYMPVNGTLKFKDGETSKSFNVTVLDDHTTSPDRSVNLLLSNQTNGSILGTSASATLIIKDTTVNFTFHLLKGWNLISIPIVPQDSNLTAFFPPDIMVNISIIWEYNSSNVTSPWAYYTTMTDKYKQGTLRSVNERQGYWVRCTDNTTFTVTGYLPENSSVTLNSGWNLVGNPITDVRQPWDVYGSAKIIWLYNSSNMTSPWAYYTTMTDKYKQGSMTQLKPGYGYWVRI